jgi:hypothetical protein
MVNRKVMRSFSAALGSPASLLAVVLIAQAEAQPPARPAVIPDAAALAERAKANLEANRSQEDGADDAARAQGQAS